MFLPPYSPHLNKIEELWGWLKDSVINNVFYTRDEIQGAVQKFIDWLSTVSQMVINRLCLCIAVGNFFFVILRRYARFIVCVLSANGTLIS